MRSAHFAYSHLQSGVTSFQIGVHITKDDWLSRDRIDEPGREFALCVGPGDLWASGETNSVNLVSPGAFLLSFCILCPNFLLIFALFALLSRFLLADVFHAGYIFLDESSL